MTKDFSCILKEVGFKITPSRLAILNTFSDDCRPINAENIHQKLKNKKINIVTIYRTLASFELAGILKRIELQKDSAYYELAGHHHHHIVCTDCGLVESFYECDIVPLSKKVLVHSSKFESVTKHSLELFGLCKSCNKS